MKLLLVDPDPDVCAAWREAFRLGDGVTIHQRRFQDVTGAQALVAPGNAFGLMDGGVDLAIARAFPPVEGRVREAIHYRHRGELLVGQAVRVPTGVEPLRWVVYAPTMRIPVRLRPDDDAVYRAMWAVLLESTYGESEIDSLLVPGLGTGAGRLPPEIAARQMAAAWWNFRHVPERPNWALARRRHHELVGDACCRGR